MVEIQKGSLNIPIVIKPRIDGNIVTVTDIKDIFSNTFVDDSTTPITFFMESKVRDETISTITWNTTNSTDSLIFFLPDDDFYSEEKKYTLLFYWTVGGEKVYTKIPITLEVKDYHLEP